MTTMIKSFQGLAPDQWAFAGGKRGMLAKLFQDGYPVPEGFVILPSAFQEEALKPEACQQLQSHLDSLRQQGSETRFAVRSSALSEDSAQASFAGEFETVLNAQSDAEILAAIDKVRQSRQSERVRAYSSAQAIDESHQMAVIIQRMVASEWAGMLFTADPITGSFTNMIGNYVHGLGEQLVSGEVDAYSFKLVRPKGQYDGPAELEPYAAKLYEYAARLEKELDSPQDIEWAVAGPPPASRRATGLLWMVVRELCAYWIE